MKKPLQLLLLSTVLALPLAVNAEDEYAPEKKSTAKTEQPAPDVSQFDKQMAEAQKNMQKMREQMAQINKTQDPKERQKLIKEHWATMQGTMPMMQGMMGYMGHPMMGGGMGGHMMNRGMMNWKDMGDYYSKLTPEQMMQRQYMMDKYMDMQNMMMDNMMQQQNMMMQPPR